MKKIVLAYSGGLDTSIILKWLQINYKAEVIAYTSNIGQDLNKKKIIQNAKRLGVKKIIIEDLKNIIVKDYVFPMIRAHAVYEGAYLLGTSIARPLIAKRQIEIAKKFKAFAVSHGATGKGNDQVRFELGYSFFGKKIKVIAPWREWKLQSRSDLIKYAKKYKIPIPKDKKGAPPFSVDDNLFHVSTEGKVLENPRNAPPEFIIQKVLEFHKKNKIRINSLEGYLRQVIGWREFMRGVYQSYSDEMESKNFFKQKRKMKKSWYEGTTGLPPLDYAIKNAKNYGWSHHIERLMILSNIMNLCEIKPTIVYKWFMEMFVDSSDWVMVPNVYGMGLFSDGGIFATKPYICGSSYFMKMMDFKKGDWCNTMDGLYWRFINRNRNFFLKNPRLSMMVRVFDKMKNDRKKLILSEADKFIKQNTI